MEGFKYQMFRAALNTLYFSGAHRGAAAADRRRRRDPDAASRAAAAARPVPAEPSARGDAEVLRARDPAAAPLQGRSDFARRDAPAADDGRFPAPPLRLRDLRRRLSRQSRIRLSGAEEIRGAVRDLRGDELRRPDRRAVVARARSRDRAERHGRAAASTASDRWFECRSVEEKRAGLRPHLRLAAAAARPRRSCARSCASCAARHQRRHARRSAPSCAWAGTSSRRSPPTRW